MKKKVIWVILGISFYTISVYFAWNHYVFLDAVRDFQKGIVDEIKPTYEECIEAGLQITFGNIYVDSYECIGK